MAVKEVELLDKAIKKLNDGELLNDFYGTETENQIIKSWFLLTSKPIIYLCNIDEDNLQAKRCRIFLFSIIKNICKPK